MKNKGFAPLSEIFLTKAEQDLKLVEKNIDDDEIAIELICFHLQQSVEKSLKSILSFNNIDFPKTHDLGGLIEIAENSEIDLPDFIDDLEKLTPYAVEGRYAILCDELADAKVFLNKTKMFIDFVKKKTQQNRQGK